MVSLLPWDLNEGDYVVTQDGRKHLVTNSNTSEVCLWIDENLRWVSRELLEQLGVRGEAGVLPAAPGSLIRTHDGRKLVRLEDNGWMVVTDSTQVWSPVIYETAEVVGRLEEVLYDAGGYTQESV